MNKALLYDDYIKLRNAKVGDMVELSTGETLTKTRAVDPIKISPCKPTKNTNLDFYDHTYV